VQEYEAREEKIAQLRVETEKKRNALDRFSAKIDSVKTEWMTPLMELIDRINAKFGHFFQSMGCAGEVDLKIPEQEVRVGEEESVLSMDFSLQDDYDKYGIRIRVQYRDNETLQELTAHHQSGGERSVATILFVMALQSLTKVPFRCVDEINQVTVHSHWCYRMLLP
jgi:chromosome segregation ATPase